MSYRNTFIRVAEDCPATSGIVPTGRGESPSVPMIQYALLMEYPYRFTHEDLIYEVYVRHKAVPEEERGEALRAELLSKEHPCLRASPLTKRYGWGAHYDGEGRIALYPMESDAYRAFAAPRDGGPRVLAAMRSKRA